jgi:hypothetical protein
MGVDAQEVEISIGGDVQVTMGTIHWEPEETASDLWGGGMGPAKVQT